MVENKVIRPDFLFEISWEVCNKVGGIHTVLVSKARETVQSMGDNYVLIGPDLQTENIHSEFEEDPAMMSHWRDLLYDSGIRIRVGRWKIDGRPLVVLVDFGSLINYRDDLLRSMWDGYGVDSISGGWDYIEPVLFGYAAGRVIANFSESVCNNATRIVAHFHEWMTVSGALYLKSNSRRVATVFTTHATVLGRALAAAGLPLYRKMEYYNTADVAKAQGVMAKHSLESIAAANVDCFTTVSVVTARECAALLKRKPDLITPNGFDVATIEGTAVKDRMRDKLLRVASFCLGTDLSTDTFIVGTSGRYEFHNKGLDLLLDSMASVEGKLTRQVLFVIAVPAANRGARQDLLGWLRSESVERESSVSRNITHYLTDSANDAILRKIAELKLDNPTSKLQILFIPTYLDGYDGVFNCNYYDFLQGQDFTMYPSYYEPWGYTPVESIALGIPTLTTSLSGFGIWVEEQRFGNRSGVEVVLRNDDNYSDAVSVIATAIVQYSNLSQNEMRKRSFNARQVAELSRWTNFFDYYVQAWSNALSESAKRTVDVVKWVTLTSSQEVDLIELTGDSNTPHWMRVMVERDLPSELAPLEELSRNLWWSWNHQAEELFEYIDSELWHDSDNNPIIFLDGLNMSRFRELLSDGEFMSKMNRVYGEFKNYIDRKPDADGVKIAYFCMEYGVHSSLKIYSGGLGILAGDYLKEASDKGVQIVAVGLLYRYGYFTQRLSASGVQETAYEAQNFYKLPIAPVRDEEGNWISVQVSLPGRNITALVWCCDIGRVKLYLLDTDHEDNQPEDRSITYYLYGGDWDNRLRQELLLGIGGVRLLEQLGVAVDVYHLNEGHAAMAAIERLRGIIQRQNLTFDEALEIVRSSQLFTTHTPVPAGHDQFPESMIRQYVSNYSDYLGISWSRFISLGTDANSVDKRFSMSRLACSTSQEVNGVSWLHGRVSRKIFSSMWPGYFPEELHIGYVTNGVHYPSWTSPVMQSIYKEYFGDEFTITNRYDAKCWQQIYRVPDNELWQARLKQKNDLMDEIRRRVSDPSQFRFDSPRTMVTIREGLKSDILTIGFARRFATYKRATLLLNNLDRLNKIVNNPQRPVRFIFAGKAHPNDRPGQELIRRIVEVSLMTPFVGKIIFLQNYDMELARRMVQGVDVWLNTPLRMQEASGTSGMKAAMNGVLNFSVLDGWWVEGYREGAGWTLPMTSLFDDDRYQNEMDSEMIYNIIEEQIAPMYYSRSDSGTPDDWMRMVKRSIADVASNFTSYRMIADYEEQYYKPLRIRTEELSRNRYESVRSLVKWKHQVEDSWHKVKILSVSRLNMNRAVIKTGVCYPIEVVVDVGDLSAADVGVEILYSSQISESAEVDVLTHNELIVAGVDGSKVRFKCEIIPDRTGIFDTTIRVFARNSRIIHRMDFPLVKWI